MDGACDELLADARLALDQNRNRRVCRFFGHAQNRFETRASGDDVLETKRARSAAFDARHPALGQDGLVAELAYHVVEKPALHGVVIDDQNTLTHHPNSCSNHRVPNWGTVAELG